VSGAAGGGSWYALAVSDAPLRVLIVDDEENLRHLLRLILTRAGYSVLDAQNGKEALARLQNVDVVLCDIRMPELDGLAFLDALPPEAPPVVMMSAYGTVDTALEAMRRGAYDYVAKPFKADEIVLTLKKLAERESLVADRGRLAVENARLHERVGEPVEGFVGRSPAVQDLLRILGRAARHDSTVLLTGESGTGKELLARALHRLSPRAKGPWVAVNCAAIPETLLESELFGHTKGAFTGAIQAKPGLFEQADHGTLFLDEIGDLPVALQSKLLRAIQEGTVRRLGARADQAVDVRIVAASAQPLTAPRFREDLYYRLAVVHLHIPPLRERAEDLPVLIDHLLSALAVRMRLPKPAVSEAALRVLLAQSWPGNVRQLENALERALVVCDGRTIQLEDLSSELRLPVSAPTSVDSLSIPAQVGMLERALIQRALVQCDGNKAAASRLLEISYKTLLYKVREYGIEP
jgi:DNA-binding NtrC family response regulator